MFKFIASLLLWWSHCSYSAYELEGILHQQSSLDESVEEELNDEAIRQEELDSVRAGAATIDDILRLSAVATTARGPRSSAEAPQVRGLDKNKIFVMVDGARQNFQTGHNSMIALDTENLKAVDIFTSSDDIAQSASLGGGVNFITKDAKDFLKPAQKSGSEFKTRYSSANAENSLNAKYIYNQKNNSGLVSMSSTSAKNLQLSNGETLPFSSFEDRAILFKNRYKKLGFKLELFQRNDNAPVDPTLNPPEQFEDLFSENVTTRSTLAVDYKAKGVFAQAYYNGFSLEKTEQENLRTSTRVMDTYGTKMNKKIKTWKVGAEVFFDQLRSSLEGDEIESYPNAQGANYIAFAENNINLGSKNILTPAARFNAYELQAGSNDKDGSAISGSVKLKTKWSPRLKSVLTWSQGFNAPRVNEVYPQGLHSPGDGYLFRDNFFIPNEELEHETSLNREFRILYESPILGGAGLVKLKGSAYENKISNFIFLERIDRSILDSVDGTTQFVNIAEVSMFGGELEAALLWDAIEARVSYSKVRGRDESQDLWLQDLPADQYNFSFNYYLDKYQVTLGYLGNYALEQHRVNPQTIQRTEKTDSYLIHNVFASKKWRNFNLDFRADNVTNQKYRRHASFLFEAREDYKLALTYRINTL